MNRIYALFLVLLSVSGILLPLRAQLVTDGATNTLSNVTNSFTGDVTVGTNGSFTLLILSDNALLTNSVRGLIGRDATAKSNEVRLVSASARWRMGNSLFVGSNGASSRLVVSNGALVENFDGVLANGIASSNNVALVIGGGSIWSNRGDLAVGHSGRENQLIVSNGGRVGNRFGYLGRQPGSSNNLALVTGSGAVWSNQFDLAVGGNDRSNRLIIEAGGVVSCANGVVSGSSSSGNNEVLVTGPGSLWSNRFFLFMGDVAGRNRLVVSNGATVWSGGGILGSLSPAISNQVIVTGPGSVWTNQSSLTLGESSSGNRVDVNDGGRLACADGSVGQGVGANNNTVFLTGAGSTWNNLTNLMVGNSGSGNALITSNGATVLAGNLFLGANSSAISNLATVTGPGTAWLVASNLYVGSNGAFNLLVVSDGASVTDDTGLLSGPSGASNRVLVTGTGSIWNNRVGLVIGNQVGGSRMVVSNGGVVLNGFGSMGHNASSNNSVQVTGAGSVWSNALLLRIGSFGVGNRVVIENGARLDSEDASVGAFSANNEAVITGAGSLWNNRDQLSVGGSGSGNRLVISNAAVASTVNALIVGESSASTGNRVVVDGGTVRATNAVGTSVLDVRRGTNALNTGLIDVDQLLLTNTLGKFQFNGGTLVTRGAFINNNAAFNVGNSGGTPAIWDIRAGVSDHVLLGQLFLGNNTTLNQLLVTNGALLASGADVFIGSGAGGNSNTAIISGMGSRWAVDTSLQAGYFGSFNRLVVSNGGWVASTFGEIGRFAVVGYNQAEVTGAGSVWTNSWDLRVGVNGTGNSLVVTNGGTVVSSNTFLGFSADSTANDVVVTGAGSVLSNRATLFVGYGGVGGNRLLVSNGGVVRDNSGEIGLNLNTISSDNVAVVTGAGSRWSNNDHLWVGVFGARNQLVVSNGGAVFGYNGVIGRLASSSNNLAVVTGAGSIWSNSAALFVGSNGMGNRLVISNGGFVAATDPSRPLFIGYEPNSSDNEVVVTGSGSVYSNVFGINVDLGENGSSNRLRIANGGLFVANVIIGDGQSSAGNALTVTDPGSRIFVPRDDIELIVGASGSRNLMVVSNGAAVIGDGASIGYSVTSSSNLAVVTGSGSVWSNQNALQVGSFGPNNRLLVADGGTVTSTNAVNVGQTTTSSNNLLHIVNGTLRVTNQIVTGTLDIRRGTNRLDSGVIEVDILRMTNGALGKFEFNGGTLVTRGAVISNGSSFTVGGPGGVPATWDVRAGAGRSHYIGGSFVVGSAASFAQLIHTNGALLTNDGAAFLGLDATSRSNSITLAGPTSRWWLGDGVVVGDLGSGNRLVVSNGASLVTASISYLGTEITSSNNEAVVTGPGSFWNSNPEYGLSVGYRGRNNRLRINDGAQIASGPSAIGELPTGSNNLALVTDAGSLWNIQGELRVGDAGAANQLVVSNGAAVTAAESVILGVLNTSSSNRVIVGGGTLRTTNVSATGTLDVRRGTNVLNAGLVEADRLLVTNTLGRFELNGGTVSVRNSTVNNAQPFRVGDGVSPAAFNLAGNGTHSFANGLTVSANAQLTGNGTIGGAVPLQLLAGSRLVPGASVGKIVLSNSPLLQGAMIMEISKDGATLTNDQIHAIAPLAYGGSLIVSNLGPGALAAGDRFPLFSATSYSGGFTNISLPPLAAGLAWTNKLVLDGSIAVVGFSQPQIASIIVSGTNIIISGSNGPPNAFYAVLASTNLTLPLSNWVSLVTNQFDSSGNFSFTNAILPGIPQRFYRIRTP